REETEPTGPLDDDALAGLEPGLVKAVDHLGERAVEWRHGEIVERIRRAEHVVAGLEVIVVGEGAREVGRRVAPRAAGSDAPHDASATSRQRARIRSTSSRGRGPVWSRAAFCCHRSGFVVPTIAVWTPGTPRVKRSAVATAVSAASRRKG